MQVLTYNKNRNKNQDYVAFSSSVVVLVSCTFSRCLVPSSSDEYISSLSIPPDFDDEVPELTNFDTSSVLFLVDISLSSSLVILASVFGFNTFPLSADIPVVYEITSSGLVVPFTISAAVTPPSSGLLIPLAMLALDISAVSSIFLSLSPIVVVVITSLGDVSASGGAISLFLSLLSLLICLYIGHQIIKSKLIILLSNL